MTVTETTEEVWSAQQVADYLGVKRETVMTYHKRWLMPRADSTRDCNRHPRRHRAGCYGWFPQTIIDWVKTRPGSGNRAY